MNVAIFGGLDRRPFPPGWTKETILAIFGGGDIDLTSSPPAEDAHLTAIAILGGIDIIVPHGTRVSVGGFGLFGGREIKVSQSGDGPLVHMNLWAFLGGIEVKEAAPTVMP